MRRAGRRTLLGFMLIMVLAAGYSVGYLLSPPEQSVASRTEPLIHPNEAPAPPTMDEGSDTPEEV